jgi:hypothetical protein
MRIRRGGDKGLTAEEVIGVGCWSADEKVKTVPSIGKTGCKPVDGQLAIGRSRSDIAGFANLQRPTAKSHIAPNRRMFILRRHFCRGQAFRSGTNVMSEFRNLSLREDERWWLRGFLIVSVLFVAMVVSASLGGSETAYNATSGVLITLFVGCGAFLGALFVDRAAAALGVFGEDEASMSQDAGAETLRQLMASGKDLDRQIDLYLRRVHREFGREPANATPKVRSAPAAAVAAEVRETPGAATSQHKAQQPKLLAEWTPPPSSTPPASSGDRKNSKRDRRDWAA